MRWGSRANVRVPPKTVAADNDPLQTFGLAAKLGCMIETVYLSPGELMPQATDDEPWLIVEASDDGQFFGSGWGRKPSGEGVFYASLPEDDVSLEAALNAATKWAGGRGVMRIWVQATPG